MHHDELLQIKEIQGQEQYGFAVYTTWKLNYDQLGSSAKILLEIFSMLHHEGITEELFERASLSPEKLDDSNVQSQVTELPYSSWETRFNLEFLGIPASYGGN
jgi:hypothetical protein